MFKLPKKPAQAAQPEALTVRAALAEMGWKSDAEQMREAAERVLGTDPAKAAAQAAEDAALHVPVSMYPPGVFDAPPILESLRREVVKLQALVEAKSTPPAELAQPAAGVKEAGETIARILKRCALIAELERDWPSIERNLSEASRNGLKAKAYSKASKGWDVEKARSWAEANGKLKKNPAAAGWPRHIHKIKG
jgi:hypothetical protein